MNNHLFLFLILIFKAILLNDQKAHRPHLTTDICFGCSANFTNEQ